MNDFSKKAIIRHQLFDLYSRNLGAVKQHLAPGGAVDINDVFVCPLCSRSFTRDYLDSDVLSLEHVPPQELGGQDKDCTLTCKQCNNDTGSDLEAPLKTDIGIRGVLSGIPGTSLDVEYCPISGGESMWLPATYKNTSEGIDIIGHPQRTPPNLIAAVSNPESMRRIGGFRIRFRHNRLRADVARLKIAYLYLFRVFGYGALISEPMDRVRRQIRNPMQNVVPRSWIVGWSPPDPIEGCISLVFWPNGLQAYLVVFELDDGKYKEHVGVVLPQPFDTNLEIYDRLPSISSEAAVVPLQEDISFVAEPDLCLYCYAVWRRVREQVLPLYRGQE